MAQTFTSSTNRKDASLTVFSAEDNTALLQAICTNSRTGYVRQLREGGPVSVPNRHAAAVRDHLNSLGWQAN